MCFQSRKKAERVWPGFAGAGIAGSAFFYWKKRLREAAVAQIVEVQVGKSQLRPKHSRSALESTIEVRLSNGRSLIVPPEFEASHLRALLAVVESES